MDERDKRNAQSGWDDRDERNQRQGNQRQPQQWRDEDNRGAGGSPWGNPDEEDYPRERNQDPQMGGSQGSYSGDRSRTDQSDEDRARRWNEGGEYRGERPSAEHGGQRRASGHYGADRYSGGGDRYTRGRYTQSRAGGYGSFTSEDYGGRDFETGARGYYGASPQDYGSTARGGADYDRQGSRRAGSDETSRGSEDYGSWREYGERRGFFEKASDTIASWFGNEDAARRREQDHRGDHRGRGPSGYTRSDERIRDDANDHLTHDPSVDATNITVKVENGEVTLDGTVDSRQAKRRAEDVIDSISGVRHVQNNLRVSDSGGYAASAAGGFGYGGSSGTRGGSSATGASGTTGTAGGGGGTSESQSGGLGGSIDTNKPPSS